VKITMHVEVPHDLPVQVARERLEGMAKKQKDLKLQWTSQTRAAFSMAGVDGILWIEPRRVVVEAELPLPLVTFQKTIEKTVKAQLDLVLSAPLPPPPAPPPPPPLPQPPAPQPPAPAAPPPPPKARRRTWKKARMDEESTDNTSGGDSGDMGGGDSGDMGGGDSETAQNTEYGPAGDEWAKEQAGQYGPAGDEWAKEQAGQYGPAGDAWAREQAKQNTEFGPAGDEWAKEQAGQYGPAGDAWAKEQAGQYGPAGDAWAKEQAAKQVSSQDLKSIDRVMRPPSPAGGGGGGGMQTASGTDTAKQVLSAIGQGLRTTVDVLTQRPSGPPPPYRPQPRPQVRPQPQPQAQPQPQPQPQAAPAGELVPAPPLLGASGVALVAIGGVLLVGAAVGLAWAASK
jgi:hypothetical protein